MSIKPPSIRSLGKLVTTTATTLDMPVGANSPGDLAIIYAQGHSTLTMTDEDGLPTSPGFTDVSRDANGTEFRVVMWRKVPAAGLGASVRVYRNVDAPGTAPKDWWGQCDIISGAGFPAYGWLDVPGTAGNYGSYSRTAHVSGSPSFISVGARVRLGTTGVAQWFGGWANGDAGLGLTADNKVIAYVNNTLGSPIGNVESTAALPIPPDGIPIWIRATITPADGQIDYWYSLKDVSDYASFASEWSAVGSLNVAGTGAGTTVRVTNSGTLLLGTRNASAASNFDGDLLAFYEAYSSLVVTNINFTRPQPNVVEVGSASVVHPTVEDGPNTPIENGIIFHANADEENLFIYGRDVFSENSLVYHCLTVDSGTLAPPEISGAPSYTRYPDRYVKALKHTLRHATFSLVASTDTEDESVYITPTAGMTANYHTLVIRGLTEVVLPPLQPQPPRVQLGCAESYNLLITDGTYERVIEQVGWSRLHWERCLDDVSKAGATIPDRLGGVACLAQVGGLVPWAYGIRIERNDQEVWSGPVTNVSRSGTDIQVDAADVLVRYQKRFLGRGLTVNYNNVDAGKLFRDVIALHAYLPSDPWQLLVPNVYTGVSVTRALHPRELKYAWDLMSELLDSAVDAYVMNGVLYVWERGVGWRYRRRLTEATSGALGLTAEAVALSRAGEDTLDGPYNMNYDFVYGTFTEEAWAERPNWSMDGAGQANFIAVPGIDSSEFGYRRISVIENTVSQSRYGVLDYVDQDRVELPEDVEPLVEEAVMRRRAESLIALRAFSPATISGGALSAEAPISMDHLRPGSLWKMDIWDHGFGQLLAAGRLSRVTVDVSIEQTGIKETVVPLLMPPGWEEG